MYSMIDEFITIAVECARMIDARAWSPLLHTVWKVKNLTTMTFNQRLGSHLKAFVFSSSASSFFFSSSTFDFKFIISLLCLHFSFVYLCCYYCRILCGPPNYTYHDPLYRSIKKNLAKFYVWPCATKLGQIWNNFMQRRKRNINYVINSMWKKAQSMNYPKSNQSEKNRLLSAHEIDRAR